ncbi:Stp1/IreP family PP2C-type Ser/Thr phosphatase [Secundilactobacillus mixtipabuli]|uniref:protein-serine/threonine phosphatase n=1 Tax=Secundilactobacillus mixtipabuli TaxID=1435342 RepID=A0A1Z5ID74_9LACO|nr:Stp1/IreP family PP2C-type Ser/Thr phosphatase [Secundilactobacillus mixtipabuli]GAW99706.1 serine/threonine protein phosphatase [Secundilactobacillus mixtipabuli]
MQIAYRTAIGKRRKDNEDSVGIFTNQQGVKLAIIADGIGGNQGGDVASEMAVTHIGHSFKLSNVKTIDETKDWLQKQISSENQDIRNRSEQFIDLKGMGTTVVLAVIFNQTVLIGNIGDSRGYLLRDHVFSQVTEDHSLVNELIKRGELSRQAARVHPKKNVITRSLGIEKAVQIDTHYLELTDNDMLLLCSDGLTDMVNDDKIQAVLENEAALQDKCDQLVKLANDAGGLDNISVVLIDDRSEVAD